MFSVLWSWWRGRRGRVREKFFSQGSHWDGGKQWRREAVTVLRKLMDQASKFETQGRGAERIFE